jgi:polyhydroxyalkanoate synthesis repressor PhaR
MADPVKTTASAESGGGVSPVRLIKKYPNRRLYDTHTSSYITLADVKELVLENELFQVIDAKTSDDLTRSILLQIILEEETGGMPIFTSTMLSQIIRFYGNAMQSMMGTYLEKNIQTFLEIQNSFQDQGKHLLGPKNFVNPDLWAQFLAGQAPIMQTMMGSYLEQSKSMVTKLQDQFQNQTRNLFGGFGFPPPTDKK